MRSTANFSKNAIFEFENFEKCHFQSFKQKKLHFFEKLAVERTCHLDAGAMSKFLFSKTQNDLFLAIWRDVSAFFLSNFDLFCCHYSKCALLLIPSKIPVFQCTESENIGIFVRFSVERLWNIPTVWQVRSNDNLVENCVKSHNFHQISSRAHFVVPQQSKNRSDKCALLLISRKVQFSLFETLKIAYF